jgi:hypothetical protein
MDMQYCMGGGDPVSGKRTVGLITAICFIITGLFAIPTFAFEESMPLQADALNNQVITKDTSIQNTLPEGTFSTSGTAVNATGAAINTSGTAVNATGTAINTGGTAVNATGAAINTSRTAVNATGAAINTSGTAVNATGAAINTGGTAVNATGAAISTTGSSLSSRAGEPARDDESQWYLPQIPMKKEHQKVLWDYCNQRNIDYIDMLALISVESNFYEKCSSGKYKGYFQISTTHHKDLAAQLKTANKPLDGAININWGTAMYSWILAGKRVKGLKDKKLRDAALSIYQRGTGGYDRYGVNKSYLAIYYKKRDIIVSYFKNRVDEKDRSE